MELYFERSSRLESPAALALALRDYCPLRFGSLLLRPQALPPSAAPLTILFWHALLAQAAESASEALLAGVATTFSFPSHPSPLPVPPSRIDFEAAVQSRSSELWARALDIERQASLGLFPA